MTHTFSVENGGAGENRVKTLGYDRAKVCSTRQEISYLSLILGHFENSLPE